MSNIYFMGRGKNKVRDDTDTGKSTSDKIPDDPDDVDKKENKFDCREMNKDFIDEDLLEIDSMSEHELDAELIKNNIDPSMASLEGRISGKIIPIVKCKSHPVNTEKHKYAIQKILLDFFRKKEETEVNKKKIIPHYFNFRYTGIIAALLIIPLIVVCTVNMDTVNTVASTEDNKINHSLVKKGDVKKDIIVKSGDSVYSILKKHTDAKNISKSFNIPGKIKPGDKVTIVLNKTNIRRLVVQKDNGRISLVMCPLKNTSAVVETKGVITKSLQYAIYNDENIPKEISDKVSGLISKQYTNIKYKEIPQNSEYRTTLRYEIGKSNRIVMSKVRIESFGI